MPEDPARKSKTRSISRTKWDRRLLHAWSWPPSVSGGGWKRVTMSLRTQGCSGANEALPSIRRPWGVCFQNRLNESLSPRDTFFILPDTSLLNGTQFLVESCQSQVHLLALTLPHKPKWANYRSSLKFVLLELKKGSILGQQYGSVGENLLYKA